MPPVKKPSHKRAQTFLRHWRKYRKLSQEKAADRVGVNRTTLGRIEKGELPYNQDFLERLAFAYGCEAGDFLTVNPLEEPATNVILLFRKASPEVQRIVEAVLKTGTG